MQFLYKKNIIIYLLLIFYICLINIFDFNKNVFFLNYGNAIIWFLLTGITYFFLGFNSRVKDKYGKVQTLFILSIIYILVYFLLGLLFGFEYSPYSKQILALFNNFLNIVIVIFLQEYVRCSLVNYNSKFNSKFIVIIIFVLININFVELESNFVSFVVLFKYLFGKFLPLVASQILYTYLASGCGLKALLAYRIPFQLITILTPIFPKLDWFVLSAFNLISYFVAFYIINNEYFTEYKRKEKKRSFLYFPILGLMVVLICFVIGLFKYKPVAIMSDSMKPVFQRGDVVIISDIEQKMVGNLKIGDIIVYRYDNSRVIHRIAEIKEYNGEIYFRTKGDNNSVVDKDYVSEDQVLGTVKMVIPKIGYPTVWLSDLFENGKPNVGMGDV